MNKALAPIEDSRKTLAAQVVERIRLAILDQSLPPGSRINQYKIAEDLQVSIVPVREALKALEAEGLVSITPRRGAFVTEISFGDLDELYFARKLLESQTAVIACHHLTDDDYAVLQSLMDAMQVSTDAGDIRLFMQQNREFHMQIYRAANNRYLLQTIEKLWEHSELYRYRYMFVLCNADIVHQEHRDIFAACRAQDEARVSQLVQDHIWHTRTGIYEQLATELHPATGDTPNGKRN
jgi:DNA-binding GntR family transcriptional regulator